MTTATTTVSVLTAEDLLKNWQGHRALTRRTIEAFPEDKLFSFSLGGMRPFAVMASEFIGMAVPIVDGVATGKWVEFGAGANPAAKLTTKAEILSLWDAQTAELEAKFPTIPPNRFTEVDKAFGQWEMSGIAMIQYAIDNEIHHRGQGYVYLRALGIEPPHFWER
jgi:uncharacterized damage-inducible protein DinB